MKTKQLQYSDFKHFDDDERLHIRALIGRRNEIEKKNLINTSALVTNRSDEYDALCWVLEVLADLEED